MLSKRYFLEGKDKQEVETYVGSAKVKQMRHSGQKDLSEPVMIFTKKSKQDWERSLHADTCGKSLGNVSVYIGKSGKSGALLEPSCQILPGLICQGSLQTWNREGGVDEGRLSEGSSIVRSGWLRGSHHVFIFYMTI